MNSCVSGDGLLSPDGKYFWTGEEWIPAPPNRSSPEPMINFKDSVVGGDITINQTIDSDKIISQMKNELQRFGNNISGFHVPEGGFSGAILLQGIQKIETNKSILQSFSDLQLIDFCVALEPFGYPQIIADAATVLIDNGRRSGDRKNIAYGHLFKAKSLEELYLLSESIYHADEAVRIARESGDLPTESQGIWSSLRVREMTNSKLNLYDSRIDELLEMSEDIDYASYCYLLASKAVYLSIEYPELSEEFEMAAYDSAVQDGDLRLEVYTALELVNNDMHKISKEQLLRLKEKCVINSLTLYAILTDFAIDILDGDVSKSIGYKLIETGEEFKIPMLQVMGNLFVHILHISERFSDKDSAIEYLNRNEVKTFFEKLKKSKMVSTDTLSMFLLLKLFGINCKLNDEMLNHEVEVTRPEFKLIFGLNHLIRNGAPNSQIQHMLIIGDNDSNELMELKTNFNQALTTSALSSGDTFDYIDIDPSNRYDSDLSQVVNNLFMELVINVNNQQWQSSLRIIDKILQERNYILSNSEDTWLLGSALHFQGVSYFHLQKLDESLRSLDESIFWNEKIGQDTTDAKELFEQISKVRQNKPPTDNFARIAAEQSNLSRRESGICGHCFKRPETTGGTAITVRGYLVAYQIGHSHAIGCPTCVRSHILKETLWNGLFGWWGIISFFLNCVMIPANLLVALSVRDNPKKLEKVRLSIQVLNAQK